MALVELFLKTPAFLSRSTDLSLTEASRSELLLIIR